MYDYLEYHASECEALMNNQELIGNGSAYFESTRIQYLEVEG
jgi:hypothetical protein